MPLTAHCENPSADGGRVTVDRGHLAHLLALEESCPLSIDEAARNARRECEIDRDVKIKMLQLDLEGANRKIEYLNSTLRNPLVVATISVVATLGVVLVTGYALKGIK